MKKIFVAILLLAALGLGLGFLAGSASAAGEPPTCTPGGLIRTFHTSVTNAPDSGINGDWAKDTFVRTTDIYAVDCKDAYLVNVFDSGTFATLAGAKSPNAGLPLPSTPVVGKFEGSASFTVTSAKGLNLGSPAGITGAPKTSEWPNRFFSDATDLKMSDAWSWTYLTACEKWTNASSGNLGDVTKICPVKPTTPGSSTSKPTPSSAGNPPPAPVPPTNIYIHVPSLNPAQFASVPNTAKGINTGDGSLSYLS